MIARAILFTLCVAMFALLFAPRPAPLDANGNLTMEVRR